MAIVTADNTACISQDWLQDGVHGPLVTRRAHVYLDEGTRAQTVLSAPTSEPLRGRAVPEPS